MVFPVHRVIYDRPKSLRPGDAASTPIPSNVDKQNPVRNLLTTIAAAAQYNRNSRTGNARRAVNQPDHDILEGLPIRRWHKKSVVVSTAVPEKPDASAVNILHNGYHELEMPKDSNMLPEITYAILRAARMGTMSNEGRNNYEEGTALGSAHKSQTEDKPGLLTRKWALFGRDLEPKEPEYLAKRRKGLRSLYGGATAPINPNSQMRKIKIRNVDSEGNSQIVEALVPEGQAVDAEIVEEELTSPTQALVPGTKIEGVGVANAEGVLVPEEQTAPSSQRRRPPPPKKRLRGPGRGKKKKVAFAPGSDSLAAPSNLQATAAKGTNLADGDIDTINGVQSIEGDNEGEDSVMHDIGQEGEEGSEEASEGEDGEEGDREEGEISATPETPSRPPDARDITKQELPTTIVTDRERSTPPAATEIEEQGIPAVGWEQQPPVLKDEPAPAQIHEANDELSNEPTSSVIAGIPSRTETEVTAASNIPVAPGTQFSDADTSPTSHPPYIPGTTSEPSSTTPAPTGPLSTAQTITEVEAFRLPDPSSQDSSEAIEVQKEPPAVIQTLPDAVNLPSKLSSLPPPDTGTTEQELSLPDKTSHAEQAEEPLTQSPPLDTPADSAPIDQLENQTHNPQLLPPPPQPSLEVVTVSTVSLDTSAPLPPLSDSMKYVPDPAPVASASALHHDRPEMSQTLPVDSLVAPLEHHTPKAPTPSPPTPIATSFDMHQRERLRESPRAPTMSPPTPGRGYSNSPDLPVASYDQPPSLEFMSVSSSRIPGLSQQLPPKDERIDVEAAPNAPENFDAEIPHDHNPLDGLAAPKVLEENDGEDDRPATLPDEQEDLLGSLERSLGK